MQIVWADARGHFPWDARCEETVVRDQPILIDGDEPARKWPLPYPIDNTMRCPMCRSEAAQRRDLVQTRRKHR